MSAIRRATIYKLASAAYEADLEVMSGEIRRDENGRWRIGNYDLQTWLDQHTGEEVVFVLGALSDERPMATRTCRTCGRDFTGLECPYCRENRIRLRGRA